MPLSKSRMLSQRNRMCNEALIKHRAKTRATEHI